MDDLHYAIFLAVDIVLEMILFCFLKRINYLLL